MSHHIVFPDFDGLSPNVNLLKLPFAHQWTQYEHTEAEDTVSRLQDASIILTCGTVPLQRQQLQQLPKLQMISLALTGMDMVDLDYCQEHGIRVTNVPDYAGNTVAEHALAMIFMLMRQTGSYHQLMQRVATGAAPVQNVYFDYPIRDVRGKKLGIIGNGAIATRLAELARNVGMEVFYFDRNGKYTGAEYLSLNTLLQQCDVIAPCCPLTPETTNMIDRAEIAQMQRHALIVNIARGGIVNEAALIDAILQQQLGGAALDVVLDEPIQRDNPIFQLIQQPNFILNPHVAWSSEDAMQGLINQAMQNIADFVSQQPMQSAV
ncbi:glycerate dehydrogenase [Vitreoscilla massiliensis]|uniref:Glycerate dehydrogenase n=1 Tax=Vitreoscilla massiliensis TaxID=1689272 RepID=A0ABY4E1S2_9NEIS|nr:NAD(P)-dependent oxidoreductase [Vitreoscilla massiliensis]UOO89725.1 glycerate dehydrogenase [Vitreoscilla massiliensis]